MTRVPSLKDLVRAVQWLVSSSLDLDEHQLGICLLEIFNVIRIS